MSLCCLAVAADKQKIAIYMAGEGSESAMRKVFGEELARAISRSDRYFAVDRTDTIGSLLAADERFFARIGDEQIKAVGQQLGVQYLCIADISVVRGGSYYLDVRLVDVVTAEIVNAATAAGDLSDGNEIAQVARWVAGEFVGTETPKALVPAQALRTSAKRSFWVGVGLEVLGAGLLAYGLYEDSNVKSTNGLPDAKRHARNRNIGYILGGAFLLNGISVHILF